MSATARTHQTAVPRAGARRTCSMGVMPLPPASKLKRRTRRDSPPPMATVPREYDMRPIGPFISTTSPARTHQSQRHAMSTRLRRPLPQSVTWTRTDRKLAHCAGHAPSLVHLDAQVERVRLQVRKRMQVGRLPHRVTDATAAYLVEFRHGCVCALGPLAIGCLNSNQQCLSGVQPLPRS